MMGKLHGYEAWRILSALKLMEPIYNTKEHRYERPRLLPGGQKNIQCSETVKSC